MAVRSATRPHPATRGAIQGAVAILLALHGVTHLFFPSYGSSDSWLVGETEGLAIGLFVIAAVLFISVGALLALGVRWWRPIAAVAALESAAFLLLYWEMALVVGVALDVLVLVGVLWLWRRSRDAAEIP